MPTENASEHEHAGVRDLYQGHAASHLGCDHESRMECEIRLSGDRCTYELRAGGKFRARANADMQRMGLPEVIIDGEVIESVPPRQPRAHVSLAVHRGEQAEGFTRVT